jgi:myo-inositol-1(or 4)-monophosphatase
VRDLKDLVDVARTAAERAAALIRAAVPPPPGEWTEKARHDFVTDVDRRSEKLIAELLSARVPGSVVLGEELSPEAGGGSGVWWIVDPLDGTTNFLHGYPQYAVSIGCVVDGALSAGVIHDVPRDTVYWGATGLGAWAGARRLEVSAETDPGRALVGTGFPFKQMDGMDRYLRQFTAVMRATSGVRRAGSAALDLADLAAGRFDAFWELSLAPWDVAAGAVLVREAGGVVTRFDGGSDVLGHGSIVAGNPAMHGWLMEILRKER